MVKRNGGSGSHGGGRTAKTPARVRFAFPATDVPLPVTVRHFSTQIAAQGVTGQTLDLDPGSYLVTIERADGTTVSQTADVADAHGETTISIVDPDDADADTTGDRTGEAQSRSESDTEAADAAPEAATGWWSTPGLGVNQKSLPRSAMNSLESISASFARQYRSLPSTRTSDAPSNESQPPQLVAREATATSDGRFSIPANARRMSSGNVRRGLSSFEVQGEARRGHFVVFDLPHGRAKRVAVSVPAGENWSVELMVSTEPFRVIPVLDNEKANALLSYISEQSYTQVASYTAARSAIDFESLLHSKMSDPIGAAIGGYGLLSLNRFSPLETWSENLTRVAPWLADGFAIHGETEARLGKHAKAARFFLEMTRVGLPVFSIGLSYAEARARIYSQHKLPDAAGSEELDRWLQAISRNVLPRLVLGEILTTVADPEVVAS